MRSARLPLVALRRSYGSAPHAPPPPRQPLPANGEPMPLPKFRDHTHRPPNDPEHHFDPHYNYEGFANVDEHWYDSLPYAEKKKVYKEVLARQYRLGRPVGVKRKWEFWELVCIPGFALAFLTYYVADKTDSPYNWAREELRLRRAERAAAQAAAGGDAGSLSSSSSSSSSTDNVAAATSHDAAAAAAAAAATSHTDAAATPDVCVVDGSAAPAAADAHHVTPLAMHLDTPEAAAATAAATSHAALDAAPAAVGERARE